VTSTGPATPHGFGCVAVVDRMLQPVSAHHDSPEEVRLGNSHDVLTAVPAGNATALAECERGFAEVLADILGAHHVSINSHFFDDLGADSMLMARFCARVRKRADLPAVSMPDVYQQPTVRSLAAALAPEVLTAVPAGNATALAECERGFAEVLADIVGVEHVPVDSNFFDDLGADSMLMARFCARVRKRPDLPAVSMPDVYQHPTVGSLAAALANGQAAALANGKAAALANDTRPTPASQPANPAALIEPPRRARNRGSVLCGTLQLLVLLGYPALTTALGVSGYYWVSAGSGVVDIYLRAVAFGGALFLGLTTFPILLKWVLIGRWKPQEIRVWSMAYFRFWLVRTLTQRNPMALFLGSPLYALYLRALGAKVGRGAIILSRNVPVCTDLLSIGDGAVIRRDAFFTGYRAHDGIIETGAVSLGKDALVGEATVLDIWTSLGDGAQLGHASALHAGQTVPDGERWHGSPAQRTDVDYRMVPTMDVSTRRRVVSATVQLANLFLLGTPLAYVIAVLALTKVPQLNALINGGPTTFTTWAFYRDDALLISAVLFFGAALLGFVVAGTFPRVLNLFIAPDKVYPLYGFHHWVQRAITRTTNIRFYMRLLGDTSYIVHFLRWLGYDLRGVRQTGSNFGEMIRHDSPFLSTVGSGTMAADGLSIMNADYSNTSFRLSRVSIGAESFLGNRIPYPAQAKTGDNCLLATKVMVPIDGQVREGVGLLGGPSFEIPRKVKRDQQLDVGSAEEMRRGLRAKNIHNTITIGLMLLAQWIFFFVVTVLYLIALALWGSNGVVMFALATVGVFVLTVAYNLLIDVLFRPLMALRPQGCSIYDRAFWRHERFWKMSIGSFVALFNGTPMKNVLHRLMGVRVGRGVFDDGLGLPERKWVTIGDDCTFNMGSTAQCHSQEDGGFKSDRIVIGAGCTLGVGAWVHYGVTMGDGAVLAADSFLMKGEDMPPNAHWGGNPARKMREPLEGLQARKITVGDNRAAVLVSGH
jgi:non-ribosomal peptide synthetase-like protein